MSTETLAPSPNKALGVVKICLIGCGRMGRMRLGVFGGMRKCVCTAVVDPCEKALENLPEGVTGYARFEDVRERYDAVWIAVPTALHVETLKTVCKSAPAYVRHVFCEAPLAYGEQDIRDMFEMCRARGMVLVPGWNRRCDDGFAELCDRCDMSRMASVTFVDKEGLPPPAAGRDAAADEIGPFGLLFKEVLVHDINLALMFMNEQMPSSVHATVHDTYGTGCCDFATCTLEYGGGRTVYLEYSRYGVDKFENSVRVVIDGEECSSGKQDPAVEIPAEELRKHAGWNSSPFVMERYAQAWKAETKNIIRLCTRERPPLRSSKENCLATAELVALAERSAVLGARIEVDAGPIMRIIPITSHESMIGVHVKNAVLGNLPFCKVVDSVDDPNISRFNTTPSMESFRPKTPQFSSDDEDDEPSTMASPIRVIDELIPVCERKDVDSLYIAFPFKVQNDVVESCLSSGKKIMCCPLLHEFPSLCEQVVKHDAFLMMDFHRRFDRKFQRAKDYVTELCNDGTIDTAVFEDFIHIENIDESGFNPVDIIYDYLIHNIDLVSWIFDEVEAEITVTRVELIKESMMLNTTFNVWLPKFDKTVSVKLHFAAASPVMVNRVTINNVAYAHEASVTDRSTSASSQHPESFLPISFFYDDALEREFKFFASQPGNLPGQGKYCETYMRTFELLSQVFDLIHETNPNEPSLSAPPIIEDSSDSEDDETSSNPDTPEFSTLGTDTLQRPRPVPAIAGLRNVGGDGIVDARPTMALAAHEAGRKNDSSPDLLAVGGRGVFSKDGKIFKPLVHDENEYHVYEAIKESLPELLQWMPRVYEHTTVNGEPYIVMEDVTHSYQNPITMDVKVGEPSDFYRMHSQPFAIKVEGYTGDPIVRRSQQSWNDLLSYFKDFVKDRRTGETHYEVFPELMEQIGQIYDIFSQQETLHMRAVSVLFVYEGTPEMPHRPIVRILDLARTKVNGSGMVSAREDHCQFKLSQKIPPTDLIDHFFCFGLENCMRLMGTIHTKFINKHALFICRHNEDETSDEMSIEGIQQAYDCAALLEHENISMIVSSPGAPTVRAARLIAEQLNVRYVIEPALADLQAVTSRRLVSSVSSDMLMDMKYVPASTQPADTNDAAHQALVHICSQYKRVVIVTNNTTFTSITDALIGQQLPGPLYFTGVTGVLPIQPTGWAIDRINVSAHMP